MPFFNYKAIDNYGEVVKGMIEDTDVDVAYDNITSSGLHILKIQQSDWFSDLYLKTVRTRSVKASEIIEFANSLSVMQRAGLPLLTSISDIAESVDNKQFTERLREIGRNIELGQSFSQALKRHQDIFPEIFISLIAIGDSD